MKLYNKHILPNLVHFACSLKPAMLLREKVVPLARGEVLEVGIGTGLNLPYYDAAQVSKLWALDPSPEMVKKAELKARAVNFPVEFIELPCEDIPLESASVDTVLVTYTLCTIVDVQQALREIGRVLKPDGELVFCEHGLAPDARIRRWQNRLAPAWRCLGGGCHLNRDIPALIEEGGFVVREMQAAYVSGWGLASYNTWGVATFAQRPQDLLAETSQQESGG
ncbi:class I SAM-dependent methyltransferase [Desulfuromonas sp. AOP6]|uniref:class I SAM-dependent methyltransferase n=1 Tax=Desulfuromonas sp. AOP6 TaxID=1566351 RepID=UPI00127036F0|nr:class I SAM-dependent methyltransferase [Desulfuromonas sp. AOP6]BCA79921.1 phospholipid methyltransferase [Desulfuromonas sp. AOP6]